MVVLMATAAVARLRQHRRHSNSKLKIYKLQFAMFVIVIDVSERPLAAAALIHIHKRHIHLWQFAGCKIVWQFLAVAV